MADGRRPVEGKGRAAIAIDAGSRRRRGGIACRMAAATHRSMPQGSRVIFDAVPGTRSVFRLSMPPSQRSRAATLEPSDITAVRVCRASIPACRRQARSKSCRTGRWFGAGWHLGERGGTQRFRWSQRPSNVGLANGEARSDQDAAAPEGGERERRHDSGRVNGAAVSSCALRRERGRIAGSECRNAVASGVNQLTARPPTPCRRQQIVRRFARARVRDAGQPRPARPVVSGFCRILLVLRLRDDV